MQSTKLTIVDIIKKSRQIPKGYTEAVNPRRTDDSIANRIKTVFNKTLHRKVKIEQHQPH